MGGRSGVGHPAASTNRAIMAMLGAVRGAEPIPLINGASKSACM